MDIEKFTDRARGFLQAAQTIAIREYHQQVTPAPAEAGPSKRAQQMIEEAKRLAQSYPVVAPDELNRPTASVLPFAAFSADGAFERNHLIAPNTLVQAPRR